LLETRIIRRSLEENIYKRLQEEGKSEVVARIMAGRFSSFPGKPQLQALDSPTLLLNGKKAVDRIVEAISKKEIIGIETDHDCDGQTAHAVIYSALIEYFKVPPSRIRSYIGHRLEEGYGLSQKLCQRILDDSPRVSLIITADNGSSDEPRIALLKEQNIDVIVTDHHEIPKEGVPISAYAVLNPTQKDCSYPDPFIAGCMVAWLLMVMVRQVLIETKIILGSTPSLSALLDYVAVGTIADCVSMARSLNNRAVVRYGLTVMEKNQRPCWQSLKNHYNPLFNDEFLAFTLGPLLNSDGRLNTALGSVSFLLAETLEEAEQWLEHLQNANAERKSLQKELLKDAEKSAWMQQSQGLKAFSIYCEKGHAGIHGIVASKIKEKFGVPCAMLAPKMFGSEQGITASVRGVPGLHIREALAFIHEKNPTLFLSFGGHQGAAGFTLKPGVSTTLFQELFHQAIEKQIEEDSTDSIQLGPTLYSDGPMDREELTLERIQTLYQQCAPFGREYEAPIFEIEGKIQAWAYIGHTKEHIRATIDYKDMIFTLVAFFVSDTSKALLEQKGALRCFISPKITLFRGLLKMELHLIYLEKIE
jgi:single-stranded-DNA-specific exonuclease